MIQQFPIQEGRIFTHIPWELIAPHEEQALDNHCGQTLKRLAERGGLCPLETVAVLTDKNYREAWPDSFIDYESLKAANYKAERMIFNILIEWEYNKR